MQLIKNWKKIRTHFGKSFASSLHAAIASVDENNHPTVTPIGTLFLNQDQTGFYFERYTSQLPRNGQVNKNICILAVDSNKWKWLKALFRGKFTSYPALKLYGTLGERRPATAKELHALKRRMRFTKGLKGHQYLWSDMDMVREITFTKVENMKLGTMTEGL